jgi:hypothetical protein
MLVETVRALGVAKAGDAVAAARARGETEADVLDILSEYRRAADRGEYGPGALHQRLVDGAFPPPKAPPPAQAASAKAFALAAARARARDGSEASERSALEAAHGAALDAMDSEDRLALIAEESRAQARKRPGLYRTEMLAALDAAQREAVR